MRMFSKLIAVTAAAASAAAVALAPALADPITGSGKAVVPKQSDVVGVGSDTSYNLLDQLMIDYNASHKTGARLYSWDALDPKTGLDNNISTKTTCAQILRPNGSSAGVSALIVNTQSGDHKHFCIDFARSSRGRKSTDPSKGPGGIVFVALAKDAETYATNSVTNAPPNLTTAQLHAIYTCTATRWNQVGGTSTATIDPQIPQVGSGTRAFWETAIGITDSTLGACVGQTAEENEGVNPVFTGPNAANVIIGYSIGKYLAEKFHSAKCINKACTPVSGVTCHPKAGQNRFSCDTHGNMVLHMINGKQPTTGTGKNTIINLHFTPNFLRTIFDVVRWTATPDNIPAYLDKIFGPASRGGWACKSPVARQDMINYGFLPTPFCGTGS
ncbi:MAG TPA: substrate-binding domain-containing protein [Streptosporangiaceae bacterium]|nr:substrate-binding domain-containing protein [Streptosporangiaceae bacterium]